MPILALLIVGTAAGFIATRLMKINADLPTTILIGITGALLGGLTLRFLMAMTGWAAGFAGAIICAMALIWLWNQAFGRR